MYRQPDPQAEAKGAACQSQAGGHPVAAAACGVDVPVDVYGRLALADRTGAGSSSDCSVDDRGRGRSDRCGWGNHLAAAREKLGLETAEQLAYWWGQIIAIQRRESAKSSTE
jgi:hypothetical protein